MPLGLKNILPVNIEATWHRMVSLKNPKRTLYNAAFLNYDFFQFTYRDTITTATNSTDTLPSNNTNPLSHSEVN